MIDTSRLVCKNGNFKLLIEADGKRHEFELTKSRALYLMESGMEALRDSEEKTNVG